MSSTVTTLKSAGRGGGGGAGGGTGGGDEKEEIVPLGPMASIMEINMRRTLLTSLIEAIGLNPAKKAINCTADAIHVYSNMITSAQTAMWDSITLNKKTLDYHVKTKTVLEGILSCTGPGTTVQDIEGMVGEMLPILNMQLGSAFTTEWNADCNIPPTLLTALNSNKPPPANNKAPEFFSVGTNDRELFDRFEMIRSSVGRMCRYGENAFGTNTEYMQKTALEWRDCKLVVVDVQDMLKREGDRVRHILSKELEAVKVESLK